MTRFVATLLLALFAAPAAAEPQPAGESPDQALCRLIETAAAANGLPADFLTRLIWRESSFRPQVTSSAGAQGIAQFMPGTAAERGLLDPYDPEQAIPASAHFLAELNRRFGSLGLAAAAYNGGPARVADWLAGPAPGPALETQDYVFFITGKAVDAFRGAAEPPSRSRRPAADAAIRLPRPGGGPAPRHADAPLGRGRFRALGRAAVRRLLQGAWRSAASPARSSAMARSSARSGRW